MQGLARVNDDLVHALSRRMSEQGTTDRIATVDQDATIIESHKREALATYVGVRGYQPMVAVWAERNVVLADEFRDGNVPAHMRVLDCARRAFAALPSSIATFYYRADSASHDKVPLRAKRAACRGKRPRN